MFASQKGRTDVVELLIKHNADVNARTKVRLHIHYFDREIGRLLFVHAYKHDIDHMLSSVNPIRMASLL